MSINHERIAVVFPGQGSQRIGMMSAYDNAEVADAVATVGAAIDVDLAAMIENADDAEALNQTVNTQPAMLALGVGVYRAVKHRLPAPLAFAGHSLGEYSALVCAGALSLPAAAVLVRRRAELMQNAVADGGMAALLGAAAADVEQICAALREDGSEVWPANYNSDAQIVIAGRRSAVETAIERIKAAGAKRAVLLPMSVPSHCPLLAGAAREFAAALAAVEWQQPAVQVLQSAADDGGEVAGDNALPPIARRLAAQLTQPIRWQALLEEMRALGAECVVEAGPGKVLTGLGKKSGIDHIALDNADALAGL